MNENKEDVITVEPFVIIFKKPYKFDGMEYTQIDLSGLENLTAKDLADADKMFTTQGNVAVMNEMTSAYAYIIASKASGRPYEFVLGLPVKEAMKVKTMVTDFLYN